jgi:hypothetical protein
MFKTIPQLYTSIYMETAIRSLIQLKFPFAYLSIFCGEKIKSLTFRTTHLCDHRGRQIEFLSTCPRAGGYHKTGCPTSKIARPTFFYKIKRNPSTPPPPKITTVIV